MNSNFYRSKFLHKKSKFFLVLNTATSYLLIAIEVSLSLSLISYSETAKTNTISKLGDS